MFARSCSFGKALMFCKNVATFAPSQSFGVYKVEMALRYLKGLNKCSFNSFIESFDTVLTDCDGVLWMGNTPLPGAAQVMNRFKELGKKIYYVTNNSTKTRVEFLAKFQSLGFNVEIDEVISTAYLAALYIESLKLPKEKKVYIVGSKGIADELNYLNINNFGVGPDVLQSDVPTLLAELKLDPDVAVVVVGFDEHFSFPKILKAATYLNNPDVHFVGTNTDERFPHGINCVIPGTGSLVNCVKTCAERDPVIVGKPESFLSEALMKRDGLVAKRALMIGDRCNTDILFGTRCGFQTLLVLTGVTALSEVSRWKEDESKRGLIPDFYTDKLGDLSEML